MSEKIRVILPSQYDLVVGDTFQLYYRGIIEAPNPYCYSIVAVCEKGRNFPRYFEFCPEQEGKHQLTISIYDAGQNLLGTATTILNVVMPKKEQKETNILCIGDSLTQEGFWVEELNRRLTKSDGNPCGLGMKNINFVGNCKKGEVGYEAFGGWTWERYMSDKEGAIWIKAPNNLTEKDQHSLWQDENEAIWQIETLQTDYLKLNRYKDHCSPRLQKGILTHYKNATNINPIEFFSSFDEKITPFYDAQSKRIDFKKYVDKLNIEKLDYIYILLGGNGLLRPSAINNSRHDYCKIVIEEVKRMVDKIKSDLPNIKIKIMSNPLLSVYGGMGSSYGAELPFTNAYDITHYVMELNLAYKGLAESKGYNEFLEYINLPSQFDSEYNYPFIEKPVNSRSKITERIDTNGGHPTVDGYMQIADVVYRNLVKELSK